uniref:Uncharacterized protein n=1 Tax=Coccidioides posadasii RMSCC 3488 TaxID=454284 RepID=A0A0J6FFJ8_COCPO|nr:hypothetical protein CPAG_05391 [Coccidioides posadasii RMSCC 3488]
MDPKRGLGFVLSQRKPNVFNPLLQDVSVEWFHCSGYCNSISIRHGIEYVAKVPVRRDQSEIYTRPEASWRRMLYQQSLPGTKMTSVCFKAGYGSHPYKTVSVPCDATMGQVYETIGSRANVARGDHLLWLYFLQPTSSKMPWFGPKAEELVKEEWADRQRWYEIHFGRPDGARLARKDRGRWMLWSKRNTRSTQRRIEWQHRRLNLLGPLPTWNRRTNLSRENCLVRAVLPELACGGVEVGDWVI